MKLNGLERNTFLLLLSAAFFNGFVTGSFQVQDIIAKKALQAYDWQITILVMLWPLSNLFSIWWGKLLEHSRSLRKFFLITAFIGRLPLVLMLFVGNYLQFLLLMVLLFSFNALISPAQNSIYQATFKRENRGLVFGYVASIGTFVVLVFSIVSGKLLDMNEQYFRYIFFAVAILGTISALIFSLIRIRKTGFPEKPFISPAQIFLGPIKRSYDVLRSNRHFACFQRNFFIYGIAYMIILPAIPKYLVDHLNMDYSETFLAKGVISQLGIMFLAPLAGRLFDRKNPAFFVFITFGALSFYPAILFLSTYMIGNHYVNYIVYLAFLVFGIAMSAIFISWSISSIYFAGDKDVSMFQSVHVTLTGLRGIFAPFLGYLIMENLGIRAVFLTAVALFLTASFLSYRLYLVMEEEKESLNEREKKIFSYFKKRINYKC